MSGRILYIVGRPGAGKSRLVAELFQGLRFVQLHRPFAHAVYENGAVQLGEVREQYPGTDALPYQVARDVLEWLPDALKVYPLVVGEGSRLGTDAFFKSVEAAGLPLVVIHLDADAQTAKERMLLRGHRAPLPVCVHQWASKADRVGRKWARVALDAREPAPALAQHVKGVIGDL